MSYHTITTITSQLLDNNWRIRQQAVTALSGTQDQQQIKRLISCLNDSHVAVRTAAIKTLVTCGENAISQLLDALNDAENLLIQANGARVLGRIGHTAALNPLIEKLTAPDETTRRYAAEALGLLHDAQAVEPLIAALNTEKLSTVLISISMALGRLANPRALDSLIECLTHPNQMLLLVTTWALSKIGDPRAISPMIDALRRQCLQLQGHSAPNDDKFEDRATIVAHAQMFGSGHANMPENIAAMIARFGEFAIPALNSLLKDPDPILRRYATFAFTQMNPEQSLETLIVQLNDPAPNVRHIALAALLKFDDPRMPALLTSALNDPDPYIQQIAMLGLNKLKNRT